MRHTQRWVLFFLVLAVFYCTKSVFAQDINWNWRDGIPEYEAGSIKIVEDGPTLLFSDSPEMVQSCGIMYRDIVQGNARIFFHHVNDTDSLKRIAVVFRNIDKYPAKISLGRKGISKPDYDYLRAGKDVQELYFLENKVQNHVISRDGLMEVLNGDGVKAKPGQLVTGMFDFSCDKLVEVTVLMLPVDMDIAVALQSYKVLPPDEGNVLRGTFPSADRIVTLKKSYKPDENKIIGVLLADNGIDQYARGIDATTGRPVVNYGNYGVIYDFSYKIKGEQKTKIRLNPWGGWFAGVGIVINDNKEVLTMYPPGKIAFGKKGTETIVISSSKGYSAGRIIFSPPGASNLPVRLFFETIEN